MESTSRKLEASEEKRFWRQSNPEVLTSSEARSPEAVFIKRSEDHQELKIIRSWENWSFKRCSNDLITPSIAEDWKNEATTNSNGFEGIGCFFVGESWKRTIVRSVQPLSPLLWFVSAIGQEQQLCLHQCSSRLGMEIDPS